MVNLSPEMAAMIEAAKKKHARNNTKVLKVPEGKMIVRLLVKPGTIKLFADRAVHWIKPGENEKPAAVVGCSQTVHGKHCDVCNAIARSLRSTVDEDSRKFISSWNARDTFIYQVYVPAGPDKSDEPQLLEVSKSLHVDICSTVGEWGIDATLVLERTGRGMKDTRYKAMPSPKAVDLPPGILDKVIDLDDWIQTEDFREGMTSKAVNEIAAITGIGVPALGGPAAAPALPAATGSVNMSGVAAPAAVPHPTSMPSTPAPAAAPATAPAAAAAVLGAVEAPATQTFDEEVTDDELEKMLSSI